ncbi:hypothetical protein SD70_10710 [Gordoniibacillus kamchatkensis]|uniref:RNA polymerase sigma-54 factor n=1 Tax=Gordoniibacillus kamchatkensis TaxID=1590651 RepID=A0ABR5AIK9_9BACL|nr:RNA polymerase factor sigma-54 [Paenibacillus sp. VKM B-2647]KIL40890.1 hypothetical protein SD70_10710 [Paenibacillus sp. VKM B-2647]
MQPGMMLTQEQQAKLVVTPAMRQSIQILQMSSLDLSQFVLEQMADNPCLEMDWDGDLRGKRGARERTGPSQADGAKAEDPLLKVSAQEETLEDLLLSQLRMLHLPAGLFRIAAFLAGNLNESGYLDISAEEAASLLNQSPQAVELALQHLQSLEPAGVGARTLAECLLAQLDRDPSAVPGAREVIRDYLPLLAQGKPDEIAARLGATTDEVRRIADYIRTLNPRPGLAFARLERQYIVPDAVVEKVQGVYTVRMENRHLPKLSINRYYEDCIKSGSSYDSAVLFLKERMEAACSMIRSIHRRQRTLNRVIEAIVAEQIPFLEHGVEGMRPVNLKTISEKLHLHESTVSRAVQNKYIQTPRGLNELKHFFSGGLQTAYGGYASSKSVKAKIAELIAAENKRKPLPDQKIAESLGMQGILIARRTIAKYREELFIPSALKRRSKSI